MNSFSIRSARRAYCSEVIPVVVYVRTGRFLCEKLLRKYFSSKVDRSVSFVSDTIEFITHKRFCMSLII